MPRERERLFRLIQESDARGVVFISGDRHLAELSRIEPSESGLDYPLYDLTSSSLNQPSGGGNENEINSRRVGEHYLQVNFGTIGIEWPLDGEARPLPPRVTLRIHDVEGQVVREQLVDEQVFAR